MKLNVGCGRNILPGWVNVDMSPLQGVDIVANLDKCSETPLPLENDSVDEFLLSHLIEHLREPLPLMQELHRIAKPEALMVIRVPYGSSDDALEDPTHVRQYFVGSFGYFSQPFYWRADYGYRGDWRTEKITLVVEEQANRGLSAQEILHKVMHQRNIVREMVAELKAVKPARQPLEELQVSPQITLHLAQ